MVFNKKMDVLLHGSKSYSEISLDVIHNHSVIHPNFKKLKGCIILDNGDEVNESNFEIERLLGFYGDRTGIEASCNEIRLNDYFSQENLNEEQQVQLGLLVIDSWKVALSKLISPDDCSFILTTQDGYTTIRMHVNRVAETSWLDEELETYDEAIVIL